MAPRSTTPKKSTKKSRSLSARSKKQADAMEKLLASPVPRKPTRSPSPAAKRSASATRASSKKPVAKKAASPAKKASPARKASPAKKAASPPAAKKGGRSSSPSKKVVAAPKKVEKAVATKTPVAVFNAVFDEKPRVYTRATTRRLDDFAGFLVIVVGTIYMVTCGYFLYREFMIDGKPSIPSFGSTKTGGQQAKPVPTKPATPTKSIPATPKA